VKIINSIDSYSSFKKSVLKGKKIGLIPTMGALHAGHASLIKRAQKECEHVIVSIFVNPIQFNNYKDLANYPSDIKGDISFLESLNVSLLFNPSGKVVYPDGPKIKNYNLDNLDTKLEGLLRPGHFQGVATVIDRLFDILKPDRAYFGLKDYQQVQVIKKLASIRAECPEIIGCPIIREDTGLAMSSRNSRLNTKQKKAASSIFRALKFAEKEIRIFPVPPEALKREMKAIIHSSGELRVEKILFAFSNSLDLINDPNSPLDHYNESVQCFISAFAGEVRLIDNYCVS